MQIDRYKISMRGFTDELEEPLNRDHRLLILMEMDITAVETVNNGDGTYNEVYKAKRIDSFQIKQGEKVVRTKDKSKKSQKLRGALYYQSEDAGKDHQEDYDKFMSWLIHPDNLTMVYSMYENQPPF